MMTWSAVALVSLVLAQAGPVVIHEPQSQSAVRQGSPVLVRGSGCPPRSTVELRSERRPLGSTTADDSGEFRTRVVFPVRRLGDAPEAGEASLVAECGGLSGGIVVVEIERRQGLPGTGVRSELAVVGVLLVMAGVVVVLMVHWRGRHGGGRLR